MANAGWLADDPGGFLRHELHIECRSTLPAEIGACAAAESHRDASGDVIGGVLELGSDAGVVFTHFHHGCDNTSRQRREQSSEYSMKCKAETKNGSPCRMEAQSNGWCYSHDPDLAAERAESRRLGGINRRRRRIAAVPKDVRLATLADVTAALETALTDALVLENSAGRSRVIASICQAALKAIEMRTLTDLEQRITELERTRVAA